MQSRVLRTLVVLVVVCVNLGMAQSRFQVGLYGVTAPHTGVNDNAIGATVALRGTIARHIAAIATVEYFQVDFTTPQSFSYLTEATGPLTALSFGLAIEIFAQWHMNIPYLLLGAEYHQYQRDITAFDAPNEFITIEESVQSAIRPVFALGHRLQLTRHWYLDSMLLYKMANPKVSRTLIHRYATSTGYTYIDSVPATINKLFFRMGIHYQF